ncbi:MAG: pyridoxine 5'-phosphate synthase, partial [Fibrobacter sp.]|nr:pyridoxine 5'-phosphate synthase [Fibrobacter sp.]
FNVAAKYAELTKPVSTLKSNDIYVGIFIDPETEQVKAAKKIGVDFVEFHTGKYATSCTLGSREEIDRELSALQDMTVLARKYGLRVKAGRGLNYRNVGPIAAIEGIEEIVIGHSIVARSVLMGLDRAVKDMLEKIKQGDN